jgi:hypothetical protein
MAFFVNLLILLIGEVQSTDKGDKKIKKFYFLFLNVAGDERWNRRRISPFASS